MQLSHFSEVKDGGEVAFFMNAMRVYGSTGLGAGLRIAGGVPT
jgi:hypothetical protein